MEESDSAYKVHLVIQKPKQLVTEEFDIFTQTYLGKLTTIVDFFESISEQEIHH